MERFETEEESILNPAMFDLEQFTDDAMRATDMFSDTLSNVIMASLPTTIDEDEAVDCPPPLESVFGTMMVFPGVQLSQIIAANGTPMWKIDLDFEEDQSVTESIISDRIRAYHKNDLNLKTATLRHDYVMAAISVSSDVKFSKVFPRLVDAMQIEGKLDELIQSPSLGTLSPLRTMTYRAMFEHSPDYYKMINGIHCFVELTTCSSDHSVHEAFKAKKDKYLPMLRVMSERVGCMCLFIIAVGPTLMLSNLKLKEDLIEELFIRRQIGHMASRQLVARGLVIEENKSSSYVELYNVATRYKVGGQNDCFSKEKYDRIFNINRRHAAEALELLTYQCISDQSKEDPINWESKEGLKNHLQEKIKESVKAHADRQFLECNGDFNNHLKSVVNLPLIFIKPQPSSLVIDERTFNELSINSSELTARFWKAAYNHMKENDQFVTNAEDRDEFYVEPTIIITLEELESLTSTLEYLGPKPSEQRNFYSRTTVYLDDSDSVELAKLGLHGKQYVKAKHPEVLSYRRDKKKWYSLLNSDVSDIENFMDSPLAQLLLPIITETNSETLSNLRTLIQAAYDVHRSPNQEKYMQHLIEITCTPLFCYSKLVSDIANELILSLRQNCKHDQYIIKKLKDFPVLLLVKPVSVKAGLFFTLLWRNEDCLTTDVELGNVFRRPHTDGVYSWTDFVSVTQAKLENWVLMESRMIALIPYWCEFHGKPSFNLPRTAEEAASSFKEVAQMTCLSLLIALADKKEIEESASTFRYIFMKSLSAYPRKNNSYLVAESFCKRPRSRLTIWIERRLIEFMEWTASGEIRAELTELTPMDTSNITDSSHNLRWVGLKNPYNRSPLFNPSQIVNLMYIGYVQNKSIGIEANSLGDLLEKIVVQEEDFTDEMRANIGLINKKIYSGTKHEYNVDLLGVATEYCFKTKLPRLKGRTYLSEKIDDIFSRYCKIEIEEVFTTLKASSNFGPSKHEHSEEPYHRAKVIERAQQYVKDGKLKVIDILDECVQEVTKEGLHSCIFSKDQHGGKREIFVLTFAGRVIQHFIETVCRGLCDLFPGETMVHPNNKISLPREHFNHVKSIFRREESSTFCDSSDASKWSQNNHPLKFAQMLMLVLPKQYHGLIWHILSLWDDKKILLPQRLTNLIHDDVDFKSYNPYVQKFADCYRGRDTCSWAHMGKIFVTIRSGFMQGILHYTSSLFHSVVNMFCEDRQMSLFYSLTGKPSKFLTLQSSDDSCQLMTFPTCSITGDPFQAKSDQWARMTCASVTMRFRQALGEELAIRNSEKKSAAFANNCYEFNSAFHFGASRIEPEVKFLFSALITTERENISDRQEEAYTQLTNFLSAGGTLYCAAFIQIGQAFFNYRILGSSITTRFSILRRALQVIPDPDLGFFPLDNTLVTGILGFKYNHWLLNRNTSLGIISKLYIDTLIQSGNLRDETSRNSMFLRQCTIMFGKRNKLNSLIERMGLPSDWKEQITENPKLLYRRPTTKLDFQLRCMKKLHSSGVSESLSTGNSTARIIAASGYILKSKVMSLISDWNEIITSADESESGNFSLLQVVLAKASQIMRTHEQPRLTNEELKLFYPFHDEYESTTLKMSNYTSVFESHKNTEFRRIVVKMSVFTKEIGYTVPPLIAVSCTWFPELIADHHHHYTEKLIKQNFEGLQLAYPWISSDINETLTSGPFRHHIEMFNWISQLADAGRVVTLVGAPVASRHGYTNLQSIVKYNYHRHAKLNLNTPANLVRETSQTDYLAARQVVAGLLTYKFDNQEKLQKLLIKALQHYHNTWSINSQAYRSRYNTLNVFCSVAANIDSGNVYPRLRSIVTCLQAYKMGVYGVWVSPQRFSHVLGCYTGLGIWQGQFWDIRVRIQVNSGKQFDPIKGEVNCTVIDYIQVSSALRKMELEVHLRQWCRDNHITDRTIEKVLDYSPCGIPNADLYFNHGRVTQDVSGIPLYTLPISEFPSVWCHDQELKIEVESRRGTPIGTMRIYTEVEGKKMTILRYTVEPNDLIPRTSIDLGFLNTTQYVKSWILYEPLEKSLAKDAISQLFGNEASEARKEMLASMIVSKFATAHLTFTRSTIDSNISTRVASNSRHQPSMIEGMSDQAVKTSIALMMSSKPKVLKSISVEAPVDSQILHEGFLSELLGLDQKQWDHVMSNLGYPQSVGMTEKREDFCLSHFPAIMKQLLEVPLSERLMVDIEEQWQGLTKEEIENFMSVNRLNLVNTGLFNRLLDLDLDPYESFLSFDPDILSEYQVMSMVEDEPIDAFNLVLEAHGFETRIDHELPEAYTEESWALMVEEEDKRLFTNVYCGEEEVRRIFKNYNGTSTNMLIEATAFQNEIAKEIVRLNRYFYGEKITNVEIEPSMETINRLESLKILVGDMATDLFNKDNHGHLIQTFEESNIISVGTLEQFATELAVEEIDWDISAMDMIATGIDSNLLSYQPSKIEQLSRLDHIRRNHPWLDDYLDELIRNNRRLAESVFYKKQVSEANENHPLVKLIKKCFPREQITVIKAPSVKEDWRSAGPVRFE